MKYLLLSTLLLFPQLLISQRVVILSVNQLPELGFSISDQDTTIKKGDSILLGIDLKVYGGSGNYSFRWSPSETLSDSTLMKPFATPIDTTTYIVTVTDENGCSFSVFYTVNVTNDIVNIGNKPQNTLYEAIIFPNPCGEEFKVRISGPPYESVRLEIVDINGKLIWKKNIKYFQSEITETLKRQFERGTYSLLITTENEVISRKFIVR